MPEKITSLGVKLYKTSIANANLIASVVGMNGVNFARPDVDSSTHDDVWKTFLPGQWDGGDISITIQFDPQDSNQVALLVADTLSSTPGTAIPTWFITYPSKADLSKKASWQFNAYIKSFSEPNHEMEGVLQAEIVFKVSGAPAYTPDDATNPALP